MGLSSNSRDILVTSHPAVGGPCDWNVTRSQVSFHCFLVEVLPVEAGQCGTMCSEVQGPPRLGSARAQHELGALDRGRGGLLVSMAQPAGWKLLRSWHHIPEISFCHSQVGGGLASLSLSFPIFTLEIINEPCVPYTVAVSSTGDDISWAPAVGPVLC